MWALLGTEDERGARIRQIALDDRDEILCLVPGWAFLLFAILVK